MKPIVESARVGGPPKPGPRLFLRVFVPGAVPEHAPSFTLDQAVAVLACETIPTTDARGLAGLEYRLVLEVLP